ncbi:platelet-activating factor acetylhydrolase IB subunit alpha2-like isoform X2 [Acipenser ruthenus]|uniref:platelet-activating factor acetylhydrolase IB subunit alpha2-like isoform X2 n=1 Tax=Acipenser ruthenus TaxID=7906 RepID=UPI0027409E44|nr:platelet-activating factor acetylhydrolase IB subunit alpha2-like isoform X2 [Acipenser ruthenus]
MFCLWGTPWCSCYTSTRSGRSSSLRSTRSASGLEATPRATCCGGCRTESWRTSHPRYWEREHPVTKIPTWKLQVVVVWVGTNNHEHTVEQIAGGIQAIVHLINTCQPQAKVVVLGLLPRGERPNPLREKNAEVNRVLRASLPRLGSVQFLDVGSGYVQSDGTISTHDMFDFLHLTPAGYAAIAKPLHDLLLQLLEETPEESRPILA